MGDESGAMPAHSLLRSWKKAMVAWSWDCVETLVDRCAARKLSLSAVKMLKFGIIQQALVSTPPAKVGPTAPVPGCQPSLNTRHHNLPYEWNQTAWSLIGKGLQ